VKAGSLWETDSVVQSQEIDLVTGHKKTVVDLTVDVERFCAGKGDGLVSVFVPHATAGVALFETGAGTEDDVLSAVDQLLPADPDRWRHRHGSPGHGRDHVLPAFIGPSVTIPVTGGRMRLGTWQSVVLVDTNVDNPNRKVILSFLSG
jgi:secondary thiamine-phosphate synthase enzyme